MFRIARKDEAVIRKISDAKTVWNLISKKISDDVSLAVIETAVEFNEKESSDRNRVYYILEGMMEIKVNDDSELLNQGDSCFISRGTEYVMSGKFKAVVVNQPAFGTESTSVRKDWETNQR